MCEVTQADVVVGRDSVRGIAAEGLLRTALSGVTLEAKPHLECWRIVERHPHPSAPIRQNPGTARSPAAHLLLTHSLKQSAGRCDSQMKASHLWHTSPLCPGFMRRTSTIEESCESSPKEASLQKRSAPGALSNWQLAAALFSLSNQTSSRLAIRDATRACAVSREHFSRAFKVAIGMSPRRWHLELRLDRAQLLLAANESSLAAIAAQCGFADQSHFTNVFKRLRRQSPGGYRREVVHLRLAHCRLREHCGIECHKRDLGAEAICGFEAFPYRRFDLLRK